VLATALNAFGDPQRDPERMVEDQILERVIPPRSNGSKEGMEGKPKSDHPSG